MNIDERVESVINKITGGISALTYGYFSHINGGTLIKVSSASETEVVDKDNIGNLNCSTNILNKLIGKYKNTFNTQLSVNNTVCNPKYIPSNCIMKDKNGYIQHGAKTELYLDYPIVNIGKTVSTDTTFGFDITKYKYNSYNIIYNYYKSTNDTTKTSITDMKYIDSHLNIVDTDNTLYGIISLKSINGYSKLRSAINSGSIKYISNKFSGKSINDIFCRYIKFTSGSTHYIAITTDLMHFTTYKIIGSNYSFAFKDGILFMYISSKDAVAMITRHPITNKLITIDGNDPENTTDYTKPYYRLIEIPFLKKYYKYSGKHVKNVAIGVIGTLTTSTSVFGVGRYPSDYTLLINVFDKVYRIGVPNFNANNIKACNTKRLQEFYTSTEQNSTALDNMNIISQIVSRYNSSTTSLSCNTNYRHFDNIIDSNLNMTVTQMNTGYDSDVDESAITVNNNLSNYTHMGVNSISDLSTPDFVIYPNVTY